MTGSQRQARTAAADALCAAAYEGSGGPETGVALVAVGGYGRAELAPHSDLDVVLVHEATGPGAVADKVWYPLWDSGRRLDHSVRSLAEMVEQAEDDLRVALGLLDVRHLAGDPGLTLRLRATVLADWRRGARHRLPALRELVRQRHGVAGELAHASVPDIKEAEGGLRDAVVLRALVATWLVDVDHTDLERCRRSLLDFRDVLHEVAGRPTDRVGPELWPELGPRLGLDDAAAVQRHLRQLGRRMSHLARLTWHRAEAVSSPRTTARGARRPQLVAIGRGIALAGGEVVLAPRARPADDPALLLRAAAHAAERGVVLAPATAARLVRECPPLPDPWPEEARDLLVRLLASGPGLLEVWETLEETGAVDRVLPEWRRVLLLPHASAVHRFTVDRHVIETCIEASRLVRQVDRPDLLLVAALLHDIGKGGLRDHSREGESVARQVARRIGWGETDADLVAVLVRWHLLLGETAVSRDPDDPATVARVTASITTRPELDLLLALTEADARATSAKAWSPWRAGLVCRLAASVRAVLDGDPPAPTGEAPPLPAGVGRDPSATVVTVCPHDDTGSRITVVGPDRVGLLAEVAGVLLALRCEVRAARAWTADLPDGTGQVAVSVWDVAGDPPDPALLRERLAAVREGRLDVAVRAARPRRATLDPVVEVRADASVSATVLEVRTGDRPGVVHAVCAVLATLGISVRSAHLSTFGPQAVDVFYVQESGAGRLSDERGASAAHAVREALAAPSGTTAEPEEYAASGGDR